MYVELCIMKMVDESVFLFIHIKNLENSLIAKEDIQGEVYEKSFSGFIHLFIY